jgi:D-amino peptidase
VKARLHRFLDSCSDDSPKSIALRALTLHMLEHLAPRFFSDEGLHSVQRLALERCANVGYGLDDDPLNAERIEAGVDVWYCRHLKGLAHMPPNPALLKKALVQFAEGSDLIYAWLIGEQAARCGVDVRITIRPRPFRGLSFIHDAYWMTHLVMLATDYFARPLVHADADEWGEALQNIVSVLADHPNDDLAGEVAFCLNFMKRPSALVLDSSAKPENAHTQATLLLAFASSSEFKNK